MFYILLIFCLVDSYRVRFRNKLLLKWEEKVDSSRVVLKNRVSDLAYPHPVCQSNTASHKGGCLCLASM